MEIPVIGDAYINAAMRATLEEWIDAYINTALAKSKHGKLVGRDSVSNECIKAAGPRLVKRSS